MKTRIVALLQWSATLATMVWRSFIDTSHGCRASHLCDNRQQSYASVCEHVCWL